MARPSWDEYFMDMAFLVATRSSCLRRSVGAIIVKDNRVLTTGYNGVPSNVTHCEVNGCLREQMNVPSGERPDIGRGLHAEQNAIIQASLYGVSIAGATLYCTTKPCSICIKMIMAAKIVRVVYHDDYMDPLTDELIKEFPIEMVKYIKKQ